MLEGPKVLFRFSLAILKLHEKDILKKTDTMGIMKHLKSCAKLTYDVDGLVKVSGETFHLTHKVPPIIYSRRQFQILPLFQN